MAAIDKIPQYVSMKDVAQKLSVSIATVSRMIKDRQLEALSVRGGWKIPLSSVQEYIQVHTHKADKVATH